MIENKDNKDCAISQIEQDSSAQLVDINCANPKTALQGRLCVLMGSGSMPRLDKEKIYTWGNRVGLPSSTLKRILNGSQSMQRRVAERLNVTTGASIEWLISGIGEPFEDLGQIHNQDQPQNKHHELSKPSSNLIDIEALTVAIRTAERALDELRRTMSPEKKSILIAGIYELYSGSSHDEETMQKTIIQLIRSAA